MPPTVKVKSADVAAKKHREETAQRVIDHLGNPLPDRRLLCVLDDEDWPAFKQAPLGGVANRGFYMPVRNGDSGWRAAPDYLRKCVFVDGQPAFDDFIYLHGSTCSSDVGLTMTFAHELQHFIQHSSVLKLWAENTLAADTLRGLNMSAFEALGLRTCDIPVEREARIVAKRAAEKLFGADAVRQHIDAKMAERVTEQDAADWDCIRKLVVSAPYDLAGETQRFFPRLKGCKSELELTLRYCHAHDPDFKDVDLDALLQETA